MTLRRRHVLAGAALAAVAGPLGAAEAEARFGLIGRIKAKTGQRDALAATLAGGTKAMPGCLSYVVAEDATDPDALWITEIWTSEAAHRASLALPQVRAAIVTGRPLIASFETIARTRPISPT